MDFSSPLPSSFIWRAASSMPPTVMSPPKAANTVLGVVANVEGDRVVARRHHLRSKELAEELEGALDPGHSGIIALVSDPGVVEIRKALEKANRVVEHAVDDVVAADIKAAAKEVETEEKADDTA